jgi:molybdate/tungstate transport system permease protein
MIAPVLIYDRFSSFGLSYARPAAVLFIIVALAVFTLLRVISERRTPVSTKTEDAGS